MTPDPRIAVVSRFLARARLAALSEPLFETIFADVADAWCNRAADVLAAADAVDPARAELGRIQAALAEFVDAIGPWALSVVHGEGPVRDAVHAARRARDGMST